MAVEDDTENREYNTGDLQRDFPSLQFFVLQGPPETKVPSLHWPLLEGLLLHEAVQLFLGSQYPFHSLTPCCGKNILCSDPATCSFCLMPPSSCLQGRVHSQSYPLFPMIPNFIGSPISPLSSLFLAWRTLVYLAILHTEDVSPLLEVFFNFPHYTLRWEGQSTSVPGTGTLP